MRRSRHAKIWQPSVRHVPSLRRYELSTFSGVDIFRLNLSHGTHEDHAKSYVCVGELEREFGRPIGILRYLQGPKLRIDSLERQAGFEHW
nr:pyruvate kinase [Bradyrhizobium shewense]